MRKVVVVIRISRAKIICMVDKRGREDNYSPLGGPILPPFPIAEAFVIEAITKVWAEVVFESWIVFYCGCQFIKRVRVST